MNNIKSYLQTSYEEFAQKATWPTLGDLQRNTVLVIVATLIFAIVIFGMDRAVQSVLGLVRGFFS